MKIRKNKQTLLIIAIILLPLSLALELNLSNPMIGYCDEVLTLFMAMYIIMLFLKGKLYRCDSNIVVLLIVFTVYGLLSNIYSGMAYNWNSAFLDAFLQWKIFVGFLVGKYISMKYSDDYVVNSIVKLCKVLLVIGAICGIISLFVDIGMASYSANQRFGIPAYYFVFGNSGRYGIIVACELLFILRKYEGKRVIVYEMLALLNMLLTTKGAVYIIFVFYIVLKFIFKKKNENAKIDFKSMIVLGLAGISALTYQISSYLLDNTAPRALLIKYGFVTAKKYFPFGSGFATYGSSEAAKHYARLYEQYGWSNKWTLGKSNGEALNDNYFATIIGETGYFGLIIFLSAFFSIFKQINAIRCNYKVKAMCMSIFIDLFVCFIATGITKSSIGMMAFLILGMFCGLFNKEKDIGVS